MKANVPRQPKELEDLSEASLKRISDYYQVRLNEEVNENYKCLEELFLKYSLVILHDMQIENSFDRNAAMIYLGNWKRIKRKSFSFEDMEAQKKWVDERLNWFSDFPTEFINDLLKEPQNG